MHSCSKCVSDFNLIFLKIWGITLLDVCCFGSGLECKDNSCSWLIKVATSFSRYGCFNDESEVSHRTCYTVYIFLFLQHYKAIMSIIQHFNVSWILQLAWFSWYYRFGSSNCETSENWNNAWMMGVHNYQYKTIANISVGQRIKSLEFSCS